MTFKIKEIILVCPNCKEELRFKENQLICQECNREYYFSREKPILVFNNDKIISEKKSVINYVKNMAQKYIPNSLFYQISLTHSHTVKKDFLYLKKILPSSSKILFIGGGIAKRGAGVRYLGRELLRNSINLEIETGPNVDLIGDAHQLPFLNDSFDCIISQAVLEHTQDSEKVIKEIRRVLKKSGIIYTIVPFMQPVHMDSDFRRFTLMGIEELHKDFKKISFGISAGPASSFGWHLAVFLATLFSFNIDFLYDILYILFFTILLPIKYLDIILARYKKAYISASGVYFMGKK